jgi:membrane protease YdiL (CAAX protease family)
MPGRARPRRGPRLAAALVPAVVERVLRPALVEQVPRDHQQSDGQFRRRRLVVVVVLLIGAGLLALSLSVRPGDARFYPLTLALALTWIIGGFASGPLHLGWIPVAGNLRRPLVTPVGIGLLAAGFFVLGALVVREISPLRHLIQAVLEHERQGSLPLIITVTVLNGVAEEVFFRGALYAAIGRRSPVLICTAIYALAVLASGNVMLVFAAVTLGTVLALQRRASGGVLASTVTHVTWSIVMLLALPALFASPA